MLTPEEKAELANVAGDNRSQGPRLELPVVRINGKSGELRKSVYVDGKPEEHPVSLPATLVILKKGRRSLKLFTATDNLFTGEYETRAQMVNVFRRTGNVVSFVESMTAPEIRTKYPAIKTIESVYGLLNGELVKIEVKGASLGEFYDYQDKLKEEKVHGYEVDTVLSVEEVKGTLGTFWKLKFAIAPLSTEFAVVKENLSLITSRLKEIDTYYAQRNADRLPKDIVPVAKDPLADEFEITGGDDINPEDIPF